MNTETLTSDQNYAVWGFCGTLIWGAVIALAFVITQVIAMGIYMGVQYGDVASTEYENMMTDLQLNGTVLSICTFATLIVCGSMILGVVKLKRRSSIKHYLGLKKVSLNNIKYWFLVIIALIIFSDSLTLFLGKPIVPEFMSSVYSSTESPWILWLALIVAAPLFEELFFRGFLISGLCSSFVGPVGAILISSVLWVAIHFQYDLYGLVTIFVAGLVLGIARLKTDSVLLTIGMHSFMNLTATIETALYVS